MSIEFENPLTAGTVLVREQIQSQNYEPGSAGWVIKANGDAEFNSVVIRGGTVVSGTALYYNGTPALGNLFMSVSASAGTDAFGNDYVQGLGLYQEEGIITARDAAGNTMQMHANLPGGGTLAGDPGLTFQPASGTGDPATVGALDPGSGSFLSLLLTSPSDVEGGTPGTDYAQIMLIGPYGGPPQIEMQAQFVTIGAASFDANGSLTTANMEWGTAQTPAPGAGGGTTSIDVDFEKTFPATPRVMITASSTADPGTVTIRGYVNSESNAGFTITAYRSSNAATNWRWWAVSDA